MEEKFGGKSKYGIKSDALFNFFKIAPKHLDPDWRPHTRRQHIDPIFDRHGPRIRSPGNLERLIHLVNQVLMRNTLRPKKSERPLEMRREPFRIPALTVAPQVLRLE